jgi:hypothetical protein
MKILEKPKFYPNLRDNQHCTQAATMMLFSVLFPNKIFTYQQLAKAMNKVKGFSTWQTHELFYYQKLGINFRYYDNFDMNRFYEEGLKYITEEYGEDSARYNRKTTKDISLEQKLCGNIASQEWFFKRERIGLSLVKMLINKGYYLMLSVNSKVLNGKKGWEGHRIICYGYDQLGLIAHDPGIPPYPCRHIPFKVFNSVWVDKAVIAVKP